MADSNLSLRTLPNPEMWYNGSENEAVLPSVVIFLTTIMALSTSLLGFVGNGVVFWLLGFCIKRNPFNTYVLNLAIADFGVVTAIVAINTIWLAQLLTYVDMHQFSIIFFNTLFRFMFSTSQCLLSLISIDSFLTTAISLTLLLNGYDHMLYIRFILNAVVCLPIMCVSTLAIFIKFCLRPPQKKKGKLLRTIWLTLFFFLLFAFPFNVIHVMALFNHQYLFYIYGFISVSVNSAINPMIYYLVGRDKRERSSKQINKVLEKLFKEEEDCCRGNQEI
ncbi:mas-related G-protein coupled receptor member H-like [Anolis carolinensis]|uniref:mas-related G-protein coupled receptor member H-like n=1 Tax=Anolis carolinensis TaxID=28377 RepID=UPI002F2B3C51